MMKRICYFLVAFSVLAMQSVKAQDAATTKGDFILDVGVGFFGDYRGFNAGRYSSTYTWSYNNATSRIQVPTLSVSLQKAFWNDITIGGQFAMNVFASKHDLYQTDGYYQHSNYSMVNLFFLGRGEYHFNRLIGWGPKYDLYAGALVGVRTSLSSETQIYEGWGTGQPGTWRRDYPDKRTTSVGPDGGIFGGIRYYFTGNMSVYAEAGVGITFFRTGLAWRL